GLRLVQWSIGTRTMLTAVVFPYTTLFRSVSGAPSGASASVAPTSISAGNSATLNVNAGSAAAGTYTLTVTATEGSVTHTTTVQLTVAPPSPNHTISKSLCRLSLAQGASGP